MEYTEYSATTVQKVTWTLYVDGNKTCVSRFLLDQSVDWLSPSKSFSIDFSAGPLLLNSL